MTNSRAGTQLKPDLHRDLLYLGRGRLLFFIVASFTFGWLWFPYVMFRNWPLPLNLMPSVSLILASALSLILYLKSTDHHYASSYSLLLGMLVSYGSIVYAHPMSHAIAFGALVITAAISLLGTRLAAIAPLVVWVVGMSMRSPGEALFGGNSLEVLLLDLLIFAFVALNSRSLTVAVEWAIGGWAKVSDALVEARERRAELHRVVRALEEATYRIERMNRELVMAHHQAEAERDSKARFAAIVSHELRGPLNLILGFSRMMVLTPERYAGALPPAYLSDIVTIYENSQHLTSLVDDVLDLSRIDADRLSLVKAEIDIEADVIATCISSVRPWARRKRLYLHSQVAEGLPSLVADRVRLCQVLLNLLTNAIRFTEHGGIAVTAAVRDDRVLISVTDTGSGIAACDLTRVFDEFRQSSKPSGGDLGGTGLGLSISRELIRLHGGDIWVTSTEGVGSEFVFALPIMASSPELGRLIPSPHGSRGSMAPKVCIVVNSDLEIVRQLARQLGDYRVVGVPDPERVPSFVEQIHPAGIIAGHDVAHVVSLRLGQQHANVPVLTCNLVHPKARYETPQVFGHLVKPFTEEMLQALMRQVDDGGVMSVLLVDDDPDAVRLMEGMLLTLPRPYQVRKAYSGPEALRSMEETVPDVALIDLVMPDMRGDELIRRMGERDRTRRIPIIVVSANDVTTEGVKMATPITVRSDRAISVDKGAALIRAAFGVFQSDYLTQSTQTLDSAVPGTESDPGLEAIPAG